MTSQLFDPNQHLTRINGNDYLEVRWRIAWMRTEHPDAILETQLHELNDEKAVFSARVQLPTGAIATGWGSEFRQLSPNYLEKAETRAIGRALAAVGFGTQFCEDFSDADTPADAPIANDHDRREFTQPMAVVEDQQTERQRQKIWAMSKNLNWSKDELNAFARDRFAMDADDLGKRTSSDLIAEMVRIHESMQDESFKGAA